MMMVWRGRSQTAPPTAMVVSNRRLTAYRWSWPAVYRSVHTTGRVTGLRWTRLGTGGRSGTRPWPWGGIGLGVLGWVWGSRGGASGGRRPASSGTGLGDWLGVYLLVECFKVRGRLSVFPGGLWWLVSDISWSGGISTWWDTNSCHSCWVEYIHVIKVQVSGWVLKVTNKQVYTYSNCTCDDTYSWLFLLL